MFDNSDANNDSAAKEVVLHLCGQPLNNSIPIQINWRKKFCCDSADRWLQVIERAVGFGGNYLAKNKPSKKSCKSMHNNC